MPRCPAMKILTPRFIFILIDFFLLRQRQDDAVSGQREMVSLAFGDRSKPAMVLSIR